ncbi:MAG: hypothetical protein J7496_08720 [Novosphingobium sp.]|nr:hypothetical protein [Novosphingobium sp.]
MAGDTPWTAGPWRLGADLNRIHPDWRDEHGNSDRSCYGRNGAVKTIATLRLSGWRGINQHVADARLIAAAPEMAEFLQKTATALKAFRDGDQDAYPSFALWEADCHALLAKIGAGA